jgi:endonuclease/exonuclease/phosphatase family metal-dependent hydrolase
MLRVASWNVHEGIPSGTDISDRAIREEVTDLLLRNRIDILGLQEVDFDASSRSSILETIQRNTSLRYSAQNILSSSSFNPICRAGVALASRYPLTDRRQILFSNPDLDTELNGASIRTHDKGAVSATAALPGLDISVVSLHTIPFRLFRREADELEFQPLWTELSAELADLLVKPLVVCGDFNTARRDLVSRSDELRLTRAILNKPTHRGQSNDDILYSGGFKATAVKILENFSDHRLCIAELVW